MPPDSILEGVRVVETGGLPGALAGRWLAELGADVTLFASTEGLSPSTVAHYHSGKRCFAFDANAVAESLASADVWIDSPPSGTSVTLPGLEESRREGSPLIVARLTPFGRSGPKASWRATDLVAQASGGLLYPNGHLSSPPVQALGLQAYHSGSVHLFFGVMLALLERERSGTGQEIDASLQETVLANVEHVTAAWLANRRVETRRGPMHWTRLFRVGACRDGWILHSGFGDWTTLREWLREGDAELPEHDDGDDLAGQRSRFERISTVLDRWAGERTAEEIAEGAQARRLPFAPVRTVDALGSDPQLEGRGFTPTAIPFRSIEATTADTPSHSSVAALRPGERALRPALEGVRILDFTHVVAGPIATRILADHGADVIKIERPTTADLERRRGLFAHLNRGKRSVILDLSKPEGAALARRLATTVDVVIDNFSARVMENWGLGPESLLELDPSLVVVSLSGFGHSGPWRDRVSFGPTLQALAGFSAAMRHDGEPPAGFGFSYADTFAGAFAAGATATALFARMRSGHGRFLDLSQYEILASAVGPLALAAEDPGALGNRPQEGPFAVHGVFPAAGRDRWVAIAVRENERPALLQILEDGSPDSPLEDRFAEWSSKRSAESAAETLQAGGIAASLVATGEDLCACDTHLRDRGYWIELEATDGRRFTQDGVPIRFSRTSAHPVRRAPLHGEHTSEVLAEALSLDRKELEMLRKAVVIGGR